MGKSHRKIRVEPHRRRKPDYRKISAALQAYMAAQAEADAEAAAHGTPPATRPVDRRRRQGRP